RGRRRPAFRTTAFRTTAFRTTAFRTTAFRTTGTPAFPLMSSRSRDQFPPTPELLTPRPSENTTQENQHPPCRKLFFTDRSKSPPKHSQIAATEMHSKKNEVNDTLPSAKRTVHKLRSAKPTRPPCRTRSQIPRPVPPGPADTSDSSVATGASLNNILRLQHKYELSLQTVCRASSVNA
ncbi:MAG: hypothetical protein RLZZ536_1744, partial [Planctomycetota bacterium]